MQPIFGILIPFLGTSLGAACVFFMKKSLGEGVQRALTGFAAGVMVAASVWSLLLPAIEQASGMGRWSFVPAAAGFWVGVAFLLALDHLIPHLHRNSRQVEGPQSRLSRTTMMVLAVTLHNIPEGMAVGVLYAGLLAENAQITAASALALSLGIAIQNFPEGAIISMPLRAEGESKRRAFFGGVLSGVVEPVGAVLTIAAAGSEMSNSCVITNEDGWLKKGVNYECSRPRFAIMNPALTCTLPPYQTASGGVDIMMHTMERYFSNTEHTELLDRMSEGLLKTVMANTKKALAEPNDYDARAELMWAGSLSHNNLMGVGKVQDWATHKIEHELGGMFDVAHGAGLAAVWGSWARYVMHANLPRFTRFAVEVMGCEMNYANLEETALAGVAAFESFCRSVGMPSNLRELGLGDITEAQMHEMAVKCTQNDTLKIGGLVRLYAADIEKIYAAAK